MTSLNSDRGEVNNYYTQLQLEKIEDDLSSCHIIFCGFARAAMREVTNEDKQLKEISEPLQTTSDKLMFFTGDKPAARGWSPLPTALLYC